MLEAHAFKSFLPIIRQKKMKTFFLLTTKFNSRYPMNGGVDRVMGIGVLAWRSIHSVEMECITRYVLFPSFSVSFPFSFFTCFIRRGPETCRSQWRKYYLVNYINKIVCACVYFSVNLLCFCDGKTMKIKFS